MSSPHTATNSQTQVVPASASPKTAVLLDSALVIRNVTVDGRRTSVRLEPEMWEALAEIGRRERCTLHDLGTLVACRRGNGSLTAAIRVFIMAYYKNAATEPGHNSAGHGSGSVLQPLFEKLAQEDQRRPRRIY